MPINLRDWMDGSSIQTWNEAQRDCDLYCCKNRGNFWFVSIHNRIKLLIGHIDKNCFHMPRKSHLFWAFQQDFFCICPFSAALKSSDAGVLGMASPFIHICPCHPNERQINVRKVSEYPWSRGLGAACGYISGEITSWPSLQIKQAVSGCQFEINHHVNICK